MDVYMYPRTTHIPYSKYFYKIYTIKYRSWYQADALYDTYTNTICIAPIQ